MKTTIKLIAVAFFTLAVESAQAETVVVVSTKSSIDKLTLEQVANIYLGKDTAFAPIDLSDRSPVRNDFYKKVAGKDATQVKAIWARVVFTGKAQPPKEVASEAEAIKAVVGNQKAIAYVDKGAVDSSVKVVLTVN